jgi:4-hydroxybenzoyl-CoA thioesterase
MTGTGPLKIRETRRVEWGDCDPAGIMFYPQCFRWFDTATHHLFTAAGRPMNELEALYGIVGCPLVDVGARFKSPLPWQSEIAIESTVTEWHTKSFVVNHTVWKAEVLAIEGREVRVCVARDGGRLKGVVVPADLRARFP